MRSWKFWLGLVVSLIFIFFALQGLNLAEFWQTLREANYWWLVPAIVIYFGGVWVRTWRWHAMLGHIKRIPTSRLFSTVVIGYMGNNVYPARAGEVLRSYVLRRNEGIPMTASLATVVLERIFDGLVMLLFVFVTLPFAPLPVIYREAIIGLSALFLGALLVFFALAASPERMSRVYAWFVDRLLPAGIRPKVHGLFDRFVVGLQSLRSPRELAVIFGATTLIWLVETTKYWLVMQAFNFQVSFFVLMLMTAVVNLATTLPAAPGNVGTFHVPGILVLTQFGVAQATATSYTFVLHAALWLPITALGAYFMLRQSLSWGDIEKATHAEEPEQLPTVAAPRLPQETEPEDMSTGVRL